MRTLLAALAFALAIPATTAPAHACGGDDIVSFDEAMATRIHHVASGQIGMVRTNDDGANEVFVSYPDLDGENSGLYGLEVVLRNDRMSRALARDHRRWSHMHHGWAAVHVVVERTGDTGPWRLVSYRLGAE